jgi:Flp pilus assembly secretin CpaC
MSPDFARRFSQRLATLAAIAVVSIGANSFSANTALAENVRPLFKNQAKVFRISRPADTIIVGNPDVLSATIQDLQTVVLTGKNFGTTNMIVLDAEGEAILDELFVVEDNERSTVRVFSGAQPTTFACSESCQAIE